MAFQLVNGSRAQPCAAHAGGAGVDIGNQEHCREASLWGFRLLIGGSAIVADSERGMRSVPPPPPPRYVHADHVSANKK